jgi:NTP pyrophosphatase (non-canonical NTP hydrolase)
MTGIKKVSLPFAEIEEKIENFGRATLEYWVIALGGEVGEMLNNTKKFLRDSSNLKVDFDKFVANTKEELADVFLYLVLLARFMGVDLEQAILEKIAEVKERRHG